MEQHQRVCRYVEAAVSAAAELDPGAPAAAAADAELAAAAAAATALGSQHRRVVATILRVVFVARERRRRDLGRVAAAHKSRVYSAPEDSQTYDYRMPSAGTPLTEEEGGVQRRGWNELVDGTAEAVGESRERGWGTLMWPTPRWPPPSAEENIGHADGWEEVGLCTS
jgi:hypothetical protein